MGFSRSGSMSSSTGRSYLEDLPPEADDGPPSGCNKLEPETIILHINIYVLLDMPVCHDVSKTRNNFLLQIPNTSYSFPKR